MAKKMYYITRSFYPFQRGGGSLMRKAAVENLKSLGWNVTVVMPNYNSFEYIDNLDLIKIPLIYNKRVSILFEMFGVYEDYLDKWVKSSFLYLKDKIKKDDTLFCSSGGELGVIKLGSLLQKEIGCKFVVNFRDPIVYTRVHNLVINSRFHVSREKSEQKYISNADLIITSSKSFQNNLKIKYPELKDKIFNNYFGYIKAISLKSQNIKDKQKLSIAYVGNMESTQRPEILYEVYKRVKNSSRLKIYFIGNYKSYKPLNKINDKNVDFIQLLPHDKFLEFMKESVDIGFVSLSSDYLGACVPSKIYEYINLAIPMLGALPDGDGKEIINIHKYGIACKYDDIDGLVNAIEKLMDRDFLLECKSNILYDRDSWSMREKILEVDRLLREYL